MRRYGDLSFKKIISSFAHMRPALDQ